MTPTELVALVTKPCPLCGKQGEIVVPREDYERYKKGFYVQDAFPQLSAGDREQILTGYHSQCWDACFKEEED